jgi:hypothetical protein
MRENDHLSNLSLTGTVNLSGWVSRMGAPDSVCREFYGIPVARVPTRSQPGFQISSVRNPLFNTERQTGVGRAAGLPRCRR